MFDNLYYLIFYLHFPNAVDCSCFYLNDCIAHT